MGIIAWRIHGAVSVPANGLSAFQPVRLYLWADGKFTRRPVSTTPAAGSCGSRRTRRPAGPGRRANTGALTRALTRRANTGGRGLTPRPGHQSSWGIPQESLEMSKGVKAVFGSYFNRFRHHHHHHHHHHNGGYGSGGWGGGGNGGGNSWGGGGQQGW